MNQVITQVGRDDEDNKYLINGKRTGTHSVLVMIFPQATQFAFFFFFFHRQSFAWVLISWDYLGKPLIMPTKITGIDSR
jgi:hypothetical protein